MNNKIFSTTQNLEVRKKGLWMIRKITVNLLLRKGRGSLKF